MGTKGSFQDDVSFCATRLSSWWDTKIDSMGAICSQRIKHNPFWKPQWACRRWHDVGWWSKTLQGSTRRVRGPEHCLRIGDPGSPHQTVSSFSKGSCSLCPWRSLLLGGGEMGVGTDFSPIHTMHIISNTFSNSTYRLVSIGRKQHLLFQSKWFCVPAFP